VSQTRLPLPLYPRKNPSMLEPSCQHSHCPYGEMVLCPTCIRAEVPHNKRILPVLPSLFRPTTIDVHSLQTFSFLLLGRQMFPYPPFGLPSLFCSPHPYISRMHINAFTTPRCFFPAFRSLASRRPFCFPSLSRFTGPSGVPLEWLGTSPPSVIPDAFDCLFSIRSAAEVLSFRF